MYWRPNSFATFGTTSRIIVKMLISDWLSNFKINLVTLLIGCQRVNSVTLGRPNCLTYIGNFWLRKTSAIYLSLLTKPFLKWHSTHPPDHRHLCPFQSLYKYHPLSLLMFHFHNNMSKLSEQQLCICVTVRLLNHELCPWFFAFAPRRVSLTWIFFLLGSRSKFFWARFSKFPDFFFFAGFVFFCFFLLLLLNHELCSWFLAVARP